MFLMLTKHPSYSFSFVTPYISVFCRNEESVQGRSYGLNHNTNGRDHKEKLGSGCAANSRCGCNHITCL